MVSAEFVPSVKAQFGEIKIFPSIAAFMICAHTAAIRMADAGADVLTPATILGHSSIQMTARHTDATDSANRRAVENLD